MQNPSSAEFSDKAHIQTAATTLLSAASSVPFAQDPGFGRAQENHTAY